MDILKKSISPAGGAPRRGRPKRVSDDAQRSAIVESARKLFIEKGYGRTTTDDVAARCRISKQTLYRLYSGKLALFAAVVDAHRYSMLALPGDYDSMPIERALEQIFQIDIDPRDERERFAILQLVVLESRQHPELEEMLRVFGADKSRAALAKWLAHQHGRGFIQIDDAESAARILMDMMFGAMVLKSSGIEMQNKAAKRREHIRRCTSIFLNGVTVRSGSKTTT